MVYPTIYRVSIIQGGAGFLPSTVGLLHHDIRHVIFINIYHQSISILECSLKLCFRGRAVEPRKIPLLIG